MKGCLSFIIKTIIAVLVFFGLLHLGVIDFIKDKIDEHKTVSKEETIKETRDIIDLSQINDEYSVVRNLNILKNRMIIAEHNASGQKMIMIEPRNENFFTKEDVKSDDFEQKLTDIASKYKYKVGKIDKIKVLQKGELKSLEQEIPYAKVEVEISNLPVKDMHGIIGVAELDNNKNLIVISVNEKNKYSQIITDAFYAQVKK